MRQVSESTKKQLKGRWELLDVGQRAIKDQGMVSALVVKHRVCAWESAVDKLKHVEHVTLNPTP